MGMVEKLTFIVSYHVTSIHTDIEIFAYLSIVHLNNL